MKKAKKPSLIVDSREKIPFDFEADDSFQAVIHRKLDAGDYSLEGLEHLVSIERKRGVDELYINFTKDKVRIKAEFDRLKDTRYKFIVVEQSCEDIFNPKQYYVNRNKINKFNPKMPVAVVVSGLTNLMLEHGVQVIFAGDKAQSMIKGILLRVWDLHKHESIGNQAN